MAVTAIAVKTTGSGATSSSFNTASVTLTSGKLYVLVVFNENTDAMARNHAASTGWTEQNFYAGPANRDDIGLTVLSKEGDGVTAAVTISFSGQSQSWVNWQMYEITGDGATWSVVQNIENRGTGTAPTVTFSAFGNAGNAAITAVGSWSYGALTTHPTGFTAISTATGDWDFWSSYDLGEPSPLAAAYDSVPDDWVAIGLEVQHAAGGGGTVNVLANHKLILAST